MPYQATTPEGRKANTAQSQRNVTLADTAIPATPQEWLDNMTISQAKMWVNYQVNGNASIKLAFLHCFAELIALREQVNQLQIQLKKKG